MLVLLDAVGEEEFRQMAHTKYLLSRRSAPPSATWTSGRIEVFVDGGAEPTHSAARARGRQMGHSVSPLWVKGLLDARSLVLGSVPCPVGGLRALKMEDEADLIDIVVSNNSSLSSNTEHHHPSADAMPQPLPNSVMKPPYIAL